LFLVALCGVRLGDWRASREIDLVDTAYAPGAMWPFLSTLP
jgi:hypothetical protein